MAPIEYFMVERIYHVDSSRCGAEDIDPFRDGIQKVSIECLSSVAASRAQALLVNDVLSTILCPFVSAFVYLIRSLSFIGSEVIASASNPTRFAIQNLRISYIVTTLLTLGQLGLWQLPDVFLGPIASSIPWFFPVEIRNSTVEPLLSNHNTTFIGSLAQMHWQRECSSELNPAYLLNPARLL
jgi:hypothetical protein